VHQDCHCFDNLLWYFAHNKKVIESGKEQQAATRGAKRPAVEAPPVDG
jgi:hypothetical protein